MVRWIEAALVYENVGQGLRLQLARASQSSLWDYFLASPSLRSLPACVTLAPATSLYSLVLDNLQFLTLSLPAGFWVSLLGFSRWVGNRLTGRARQKDKNR